MFQPSTTAHPGNAASAQRRNKITSALRAAFPYTVPILAGFLLTGITCGVFATSLGLPWWAPTLMSIAVFAGSAEFVTASLIAGAASPINAFITIFIVNARHLFYGLSMLERFRGDGKKRLYTIYAMCDETFSLNYATVPPDGVDRGWFMFFIALLNQIYWVAGCTLGGVAGGMLPLAEVKGISFAMTALFVVIFLDQWLKDRSHAGAVIGLIATAAALVVLGPGNFMMPALVLILLGALAVRKRVEPAYFSANPIQTAATPSASSATASSGFASTASASSASTTVGPAISACTSTASTASTTPADNLSKEIEEKKDGAAE